MKHIIFDLDGTLIDSMPVWKNTGRAFLEKYGYPVPPDLQNTVKSMTLPQTAQYFRSCLGVTHTPQEIVSEIASYVEEQYRTSIPLKPFAREFLQKQKEKGVNMCILTASEAEYIMPAIERLEILPYFDFIMTCTQVGAFKEEATPFLAAMQRLGGTVKDTAVFEDALYAMRGAKKAGLEVIAVADPVTESDTAAVRSVADRYIQSFAELL